MGPSLLFAEPSRAFLLTEPSRAFCPTDQAELAFLHSAEPSFLPKLRAELSQAELTDLHFFYV